MSKLSLLLLTALAVAAQPATRSVTISPSNPNAASVTIAGTTFSTSSSATGPWTQIGCVGTVAGSTCVAGSTAFSSFTDPVETIGTTVYYQVVYIGPACVTGQNVPCGNAATISPPVPIAAKVIGPSLIIIEN